MNGQETSSPKRFLSWDRFRTEAKPGDTYVERDFSKKYPVRVARCFEPGGFYVVWVTRSHRLVSENYEIHVAYGRSGKYSMTYVTGYPNSVLRSMEIGPRTATVYRKSDIAKAVEEAFEFMTARVAQFRANGGREY